jgi:alpha-ribazole phosphatase
MQVYVIRHTAVAISKDYCYGQTNVPLAGTFLQDKDFIKNQLPTDFDVVYCSPLQRCKDLATALDLKDVQFVDALMEMDFGDWENKKWSDIDEDALNNWMADFVNVKTPGGENLTELFNRIQIFMDDLRLQSHKKVLLITHAGVIRCLWAYILETPLKNIFKIPVAYKEVFVFKLTDSPPTDSIVQIK